MTRRVAGVILAGGLSTRMGGMEKAFLDLRGRPLVAHAIDRLGPQVERLAINANGDPGRFAAFGLDVVADTLPDHPGPLAGLLAGMGWAAERGCTHVATVAVDTPFFPRDLVARLAGGVRSAPDVPALAERHGRLQPVFGLWPVALRGELDVFLARGETLKVAAFAAHCGAISVPFPDAETGDPFFNVNRPEDLAAAAAQYAGTDP